MKPGVLNKQIRYLRKKSEILLIFVFLFLFVFCSAILDSSFLTLENIGNLLTTSLPLILVSYAQAIVVLAGGLDLSVGTIICLSNVICATTMKDEPFGFLLGIIIALVVGSASGFANGLIITKGKQQPLISTLAVSSIIGGISLAILPQPGGFVHTGYSNFLTGKVMGIPMSLIIIVIATLLVWLLTNNTRFGRGIYAIGGNETSAYSTGIQVDKVKITAYCLSGLLSTLAGMYLSAQMYSGDPTIGLNYTLRSITTVVIGGTSLAGGRGGILGCLAGAFILVIINNILNLVSVSTFYQFILQGAILIIALAISSLRSRRY